MLFSKTLKNRLLAGLAAAGCAIAAMPLATFAQNSGLTIFSGVNRPNLLNYRIEHGGRNARNARYKLRIPAKKVEGTVAQISVYYPDYYGEADERFRDVVCVENCEVTEGDEHPNRIFAFEDPEDVIEIGYGRGYDKEVGVGNVRIEENCYRVWDGDEEKYFNCLRIPLTESIEARNPIQIKLEHIRNPWFGGTFYFHALLVTCLDENGCFTEADHEPVNDSPEFADFRRASIDYVGTWIVSIAD